MEFGVGSIVEGKVSGITKFGAFISLPEGKSGLVHISEIAYSYVSDVHEHLSEGDQVKVKVIGIDDAGRINLSIKKAAEPPARPAASRPQNGAPRPAAPRPQNSAPRERTFTPAAPKEPTSFEDRLKQFMAASDSKLSDLRSAERRTSRRGGGGGRK